jgi:putative addiction module CopG family antidote
MKTVPITLHTKQERFLESAVNSGDFVTPSEVVETALDLLAQQEALRQARQQELKTKIAEGIAELDHGETVEFVLPDFLAGMHTKHAAKSA